MRRAFALAICNCIACLLLVVSLGACTPIVYAPPPQPVSPPPEILAGPLIGKTWQVESISIPGVAELATFTQPVWLLFDAVGIVQIEANECTYQGQVATYGAGSSLKIVELPRVWPSPVCSADHLVRLVDGALIDITEYAVEGDRLTLRNDDATIVMALTLEVR